jgi:16S rRNA (guanine527-N7)-methyltransferase
VSSVAIPESFRIALEAESLEVPTSVQEQLAEFLELLLLANRTHNLTAIRDQQQAWNRHLLESVMLSGFLGTARAIVDIGSGGGVPGLPLAILNPDKRFSLVESVGKKTSFLRSAVSSLGIENVSVYNLRVEEIGRDPEFRGKSDLVTARALGGLAELVELAMPLLKLSGSLLAIKGLKAEVEIAEAKRALELLGAQTASVKPLFASGFGESVVVEVIKARETPDKYPRRNGLPKKRPL